ncbi:hypothetical protein D3C73_665580 [compost metagenome]
MIYALASTPKLRCRLTSLALIGFFTAASCTLVSQQIRLSELTQHLDELADSTALQHISDRVLELERSAATSLSDPAGVSYAELNQINDSLNERITELANAMAAVATQSDLVAITQRIQQLESNLVKPERPPASVRTKKPARTPKSPTSNAPAIQILGQELRGGEQFLSVGPSGSQKLTQCQLLRIGETYLGFTLVAIEGPSAVFSADGQIHRLTIR